MEELTRGGGVKWWEGEWWEGEWWECEFILILDSIKILLAKWKLFSFICRCEG